LQETGKCIKNAEQTEDLLNELIAKIPTETNAQVIVAPTFVNLASASHLEFTNIAVAAQNMHQAEGGVPLQAKFCRYAKSVGVQTVGHSERRAIFHETDAIIADKVNTALAHDMTVLLFW
jgi:triosephosphate isomerase